MQEQQLKARQLVLQQQAASATAAASKTQREVRPPTGPSKHAMPGARPWTAHAAHHPLRQGLRCGVAACQPLARGPSAGVCLCAGAVSLCAGAGCVHTLAPARLGALLSCDLLAAALRDVAPPRAPPLRLGCSPRLCPAVSQQAPGTWARLLLPGAVCVPVTRVAVTTSVS